MEKPSVPSFSVDDDFNVSVDDEALSAYVKAMAKIIIPPMETGYWIPLMDRQ
ncbi:MAG: hypothetical protein ACLVH0_04245 [Coprococcus eutactus]